MPLTDMDIQTESPDKAFEQLYIALRDKEQRLYTDAQLLHLPDIDAGHEHAKEWQVRKHSAERLIAYLTKKRTPLNILEIGCGNGWLANKLAQIPNATVTAIDINRVEIEQAKRVFKKDSLAFICGEVDANDFIADPFDVVVFAASVQYFPSLPAILHEALSTLKPNGEVHLIDTNFYTAEVAFQAAQRTLDYYSSMGCPKLAEYYFHHQMNDLDGFNYKILANPNSLLNRLQKSNPFYWICINKQ